MNRSLVNTLVFGSLFFILWFNWISPYKPTSNSMLPGRPSSISASSDLAQSNLRSAKQSINPTAAALARRQALEQSRVHDAQQIKTPAAVPDNLDADGKLEMQKRLSSLPPSKTAQKLLSSMGSLGSDPLAQRLTQLLSASESGWSLKEIEDARKSVLAEFQIDPDHGYSVLTKAIGAVSNSDNPLAKASLMDALSKFPGKSDEVQKLALKEFAASADPKGLHPEIVSSSYRAFMATKPNDDLALLATSRGVAAQTNPSYRREMIQMFRAAYPQRSPELDVKLRGMGLDPSSFPDPFRRQ